MDVRKFIGHNWTEDEVCCLYWSRRLFIAKVLVKAADGVGTSGIAGTDFLGEGCDRVFRSPVVVTQCVKEVESILRLLAARKGAQLHGEKRANFTNSNRQILRRVE